MIAHTTTASLKKGEYPAAEAAAAVRYLAEHGYETTTAGELADAIGISRSTFFRRFGSKEDVVFADHDLAGIRLEHLLADVTLSPGDAIIRAALEVLHTLTRDRATARLRWELLRQNPSLRERELVLTHRYERDFAKYLASRVPASTPEWVPIAIAAAVVAVHNAALRQWLRTDDSRALTTLERELHELIARFSPWFGGPERPSRVMIASFDADATPEEVMRAVAAQLGTPHAQEAP